MLEWEDNGIGWEGGEVGMKLLRAVRDDVLDYA